MDIMAKELKIDENRCRDLAKFVVSEKSINLDSPVFDSVSMNTRIGALFASYHCFAKRREYEYASAAACEVIHALMEGSQWAEARSAAKIMLDNSGGSRRIAYGVAAPFIWHDEEYESEKGYYMLLGAAGSDEDFNEIMDAFEEYNSILQDEGFRGIVSAISPYFWGAIIIMPVIFLFLTK